MTPQGFEPWFQPRGAVRLGLPGDGEAIVSRGVSREERPRGRNGRARSDPTGIRTLVSALKGPCAWACAWAFPMMAKPSSLAAQPRGEAQGTKRSGAK